MAMAITFKWYKKSHYTHQKNTKIFRIIGKNLEKIFWKIPRAIIWNPKKKLAYKQQDHEIIFYNV